MLVSGVSKVANSVIVHFFIDRGSELDDISIMRKLINVEVVSLR